MPSCTQIIGRLEKQKNEKFEQYYVVAKAAGISVEAYWYSYLTAPEYEADSVRKYVIFDEAMACLRRKQIDLVAARFQMKNRSNRPICSCSSCIGDAQGFVMIQVTAHRFQSVKRQISLGCIALRFCFRVAIDHAVRFKRTDRLISQRMIFRRWKAGEYHRNPRKFYVCTDRPHRGRNRDFLYAGFQKRTLPDDFQISRKY